MDNGNIKEIITKRCLRCGKELCRTSKLCRKCFCKKGLCVSRRINKIRKRELINDNSRSDDNIRIDDCIMVHRLLIS